MYNIWEKIASDDEISQCKGDYIGCEICRNSLRCMELLLEQLESKD